jgi:hypothetical protein
MKKYDPFKREKVIKISKEDADLLNRTPAILQVAAAPPCCVHSLELCNECMVFRDHMYFDLKKAKTEILDEIESWFRNQTLSVTLVYFKYKRSKMDL